MACDTVQCRTTSLVMLTHIMSSYTQDIYSGFFLNQERMNYIAIIFIYMPQTFLLKCILLRPTLRVFFRCKSGLPLVGCVAQEACPLGWKHSTSGATDQSCFHTSLRSQYCTLRQNSAPLYQTLSTLHPGRIYTYMYSQYTVHVQRKIAAYFTHTLYRIKQQYRAVI